MDAKMIDLCPEGVRALRDAVDILAPKKPKGFDDVLGPFTTLVYDRGCNEPIGWGYKILRKLEDDEADKLKKHGDIEFLHSQTDDGHDEFGVVVRWLTAAEAKARYGAAGEATYGPRGGFRQVFYGTKAFNHRKMKP